MSCTCEKWDESQNKKEGGGGGGRKEMLADKHLDFETLSPANGALDWLD